MPSGNIDEEDAIGLIVALTSPRSGPEPTAESQEEMLSRLDRVLQKATRGIELQYGEAGDLLERISLAPRAAPPYRAAQPR